MKTSIRSFAFSIVFFGAVSAAPAFAGQPVTLDLAVPETPAVAAVSGSSGAVLKPSTAREFSASLLNIVDRKGKVAPGVSVEVTPYLLAKGLAQVPGYTEQSAKGYLLRSAVGTQLSLATANKNEKTGKAQNIAVGLRVPIFDKGDPRLSKSLDDCFRALPTPEIGAEEDPTTFKAIDVLPAALTAGLTKCYEFARQSSWNAAAMTFAAAQLYTDLGETESDLKRDSRQFWLSFGMPLGTPSKQTFVINKKQLVTERTPGQLIVQAKAVYNAIAAGEGDVATRRYDGVAGAAKLRWGSEKFNVNLAASHERRKFEFDSRKETSRVITGGFEGRLKKDLWVRLEIGRESKTSSNASPYANLVINWASESEPQYDPRPLLSP